MDPVTVSALTTHIVSLFQTDDFLRDVYVLGEVSNWKHAASGHVYFSLKDEGASVNAVMWRGSAASHSWLPDNGDQVLAKGYVDVYPERGAYQFYVNRIQPAGRGQLYAQFEALKAKLHEAGLFDPERKQRLPSKVRRLGVVTSANAAALRDILRVLSARWPLTEVVVFPTLVQGADAPGTIAAALRNAVEYDRRHGKLDVLILSRGGGSMEDLWAFNDEQVAYSIVECPLPVISGVGHETDFTIADFVADERAPTPSAAAARVVPDQTEVRAQIAGIAAYLAAAQQEAIARRRQALNAQRHRLERLQPQRTLDQRRQALDDRQRRLDATLRHLVNHLRTRTYAAAQELAAINPESVLRRGYSIVTSEAGTVVTSPKEVVPGEALVVQSYGGEYEVTVRE